MSMATVKLRDFFSTELLTKAVRALDRTAVVMIIVTWAAAVFMMGVALYTVSKAHYARQKAEEAAALEPLVPAMKHGVLARRDLERLTTRLKMRFRTVNINATPDNAVEISGTDAGAFLDWLSALSYLDTIAPQVRWSIRDLCIGSECGGASLMRAAIIAERVTFQAPQPRSDENQKDGKS